MIEKRWLLAGAICLALIPAKAGAQVAQQYWQCAPTTNGWCPEGQTYPMPVTPTTGAPGAPVAIAPVRGTASATDNAAHTIIAAQGAGIKLNILTMQCSNSSATSITGTLNDSVSTPLYIPANSSTNPVFGEPLSVAANTAFTFTPSTGVTTATCNAQGYTSL